MLADELWRVQDGVLQLSYFSQQFLYHHPLYPPGPAPEVESGKHHFVMVLLSLVGVGRQEEIEL